jgi:hypothetical protein
MISTGHYFTIIIIYIGLALILVILKEKKINKFDRLRRMAKRIYNNRFKHGALNEVIWFSYLSFAFFSMYQIQDLTVGEPWRYGNLVLSFFCLIIVIIFPMFIIHKTLQYKKDLAKLPKKYSFIVGD